MIFEIAVTIAIFAIAFGSLDSFARQDRERTFMHKRIKKLEEEKAMLENYLEVHKQEYLGKGFGIKDKNSNPWAILGSISIIKEKYVKNELPCKKHIQ
jgi:hypothetical protein